MFVKGKNRTFLLAYILVKKSPGNIFVKQIYVFQLYFQEYKYRVCLENGFCGCTVQDFYDNLSESIWGSEINRKTYKNVSFVSRIT